MTDVGLPSAVSRRRAPQRRSFDATFRQAKRGDGDAFAELFHQVAPKIRGFVAARGVEDPDLTTNEVMLRAFRNLERHGGGERAFIGWVFQIARNLVVDEFRARRSRGDTVPFEDDAHACAEPTVEDWFDDTQGVQWILELVNRLTPDQREVVLLRVVSGLSFAEIGASMGRRPATVRSLFKRARAALEVMVTDSV